jgi:hypothetical protein
MNNYASYKEINLKLTDEFKVAFPDKLIPNNCYLDKSKTGLGMTYAEFYADRNSIIVIPSLPIIDDKIVSYKERNPFKVWAKVKPKSIIKYIESDLEFKKIVTTPEGFKRIIQAVTTMEKLDWLYENFFCLLDEVQCYATDRYRSKILRPFAWFWKFQNKAMGTATPYHFSDRKFTTLDFIKLQYTEKFGTINLVEHHKPMEALNYFLSNPSLTLGNVHIFFNSVKEIGKAIKASKITDVNVFCRDDEQNKANLKDAEVYFRSNPSETHFKKFNFYSCRYNEGWDLFDDETATMIVVTDIKIPHSLIGIKHKAFQAVGRLRSLEKDENNRPKSIKPDMIYHITNTFESSEYIDFETIKTNWLYEAEAHIEYHNQHLFNCTKDGMLDKQLTKKLLYNLAKYGEGGKAKVHVMKLDQMIYEEYSKERYANIKTVAATWQECNYTTVIQMYNINPLYTPKDSKQEINKAVVESWCRYQQDPTSYFDGPAKRSLEKLRNRFSSLYLSFIALGPEKLDQLGFDDAKMLAARMELHRENKRSFIVSAIKEKLLIGVSYTSREIKSVLNQLFAEHEIKDSRGITKKATAGVVEKDYDFKLGSGPKRVIDGKRVVTFRLLPTPEVE